MVCFEVFVVYLQSYHIRNKTKTLHCGQEAFSPRLCGVARFVLFRMW